MKADLNAFLSTYDDAALRTYAEQIGAFRHGMSSSEVMTSVADRLEKAGFRAENGKLSRGETAVGSGVNVASPRFARAKGPEPRDQADCPDGTVFRRGVVDKNGVARRATCAKLPVRVASGAARRANPWVETIRLIAQPGVSAAQLAKALSASQLYHPDKDPQQIAREFRAGAGQQFAGRVAASPRARPYQYRGKYQRRSGALSPREASPRSARSRSASRRSTSFGGY